VDDGVDVVPHDHLAGGQGPPFNTDLDGETNLRD
jgi:hypothetical protein